MTAHRGLLTEKQAQKIKDSYPEVMFHSPDFRIVSEHDCTIRLQAIFGDLHAEVSDGHGMSKSCEINFNMLYNALLLLIDNINAEAFWDKSYDEALEDSPLRPLKTKPKVWNRNDKTKPANAQYVGRPSVWGNPYPLKKEEDRELVLARFRVYAENKLKNEPDWLEPLRGKDLVCFCAPKLCHADVLLELANKPVVDSKIIPRKKQRFVIKKRG
jgi:hypothetical protein